MIMMMMMMLIIIIIITLFLTLGIFTTEGNINKIIIIIMCKLDSSCTLQRH